MYLEIQFCILWEAAVIAILSNWPHLSSATNNLADHIRLVVTDTLPIHTVTYIQPLSLPFLSLSSLSNRFFNWTNPPVLLWTMLNQHGAWARSGGRPHGLTSERERKSWSKSSSATKKRPLCNQHLTPLLWISDGNPTNI